MCTGFEPLLLEAGAGEMFLGDMLATGAGEGLAGMGLGEAAGAGSFLGDMAATGAGGGLTAGGLGAAEMAGLGGVGGASYLESLGGLDSLAGSQFAESMAPFTESATNVSSITGNAVPGLENNISTFEGVPESGGITPPAQEPIPGLSQGSNLASRGVSLQAPPEAGLAGQNYIDGNAFSGQGLSSTTPFAGPANGGVGMQGTMGAGTSLGYGSGALDTLAAPTEGYFAGATTPAASTSPFSLENLMNNPMGAVKSAYDTVSKNPVPSMYAAGSLYDMYAKNKMAKAQEGIYNQNRADIMNSYAPGSPEYNQLAQQIARKDAASGRNSQYGARANDLAATIAKLRMNALGPLQSGQNALANQRLSNQYGMFNTPMALAMYSSKT
jgi:hypothetical protein